MKKLLYLILISLSGCIKLLPDPEPPAQKIWIELDSSFTNENATYVKSYPKVQLLIDRPQLNPGLDSTKIRVIDYRDNISTLTYLKDYEWPNLLGDIMARNLIDYFSSSNQFFSVLSSEANNSGTHKFKVMISRCDLDLRADPLLRVEGQFTLFNNQTSKIIGQQYFKYDFPLFRINITAISDGYKQAFNKINYESNQFLKVYFN